MANVTQSHRGIDPLGGFGSLVPGSTPSRFRFMNCRRFIGPWSLCLIASGYLTPELAAAPLPAPPTRDWVLRLFDGLKAPVPPRHLVANIYYVGVSGISSFLITTPEGHILIDTGFADTAPLIARSVEQLGFKLSDIKILLSSHAHIDHTLSLIHI